MHIFKNTNFDFLRWRWYAMGLSALIILAGVVAFVQKGIVLGVEFGGGTAIVAQFDSQPSIEQVRNALAQYYPGGAQNTVVAEFGNPSERRVMIRVPQAGEEQGAALTVEAEKVEAALKQANVGNFTIVGREVVGPSVGRELTSKGIWATVLSLAGILAYIGFRFQFSFAVGAVVATIHDLLVTLAFLVIFGYDMTLNVIAALLTITGFSTNDTIVIFDRVRENLRSMRRDSLDHVINVAVNQTLGRTVITSGTALLSSIALLLFGGEVLHGFAVTMVVGIITGTYSTVFIAAAIVSLWRSKAPARAASRAPATVPAPVPQQPARKSKPQRKARAS
jgi:preprotein translocase subunit SecF